MSAPTKAQLKDRCTVERYRWDDSGDVLLGRDIVMDNVPCSLFQVSSVPAADEETVDTFAVPHEDGLYIDRAAGVEMNDVVLRVRKRNGSPIVGDQEYQVVSVYPWQSGIDELRIRLGAGYG